jgi:hypothetical protein
MTCRTDFFTYLWRAQNDTSVVTLHEVESLPCALDLSYVTIIQKLEQLRKKTHTGISARNRGFKLAIANGRQNGRDYNRLCPTSG